MTTSDIPSSLPRRPFCWILGSPYTSPGGASRLKHAGRRERPPIASLGRDAYCIMTSNPYLSDQSYVVVSLGAAGSIQILAYSCTQGTDLAKDALARISGL